MSEKTATIPYLAYSTLKNTIQKLAPDGQLPTRIDNSVLHNMSGAARSQFLNALRFFNFIGEDGVPSEKLKTLAVSGEPKWRENFKPVLTAHYSNDVLAALASGTPASLKEALGDVGQSILKPATRFLVKAAQDVGIPVTSHIAKAKQSQNGTTSSKKTPRKARTPKPPVTHANGVDFKAELLAKFPEFNPAWDDAQQKSWFSAYEKLLSMGSRKGGGSDD